MKFISKKREFRLIISPAEVTVDESKRPHIYRGERVEFKEYVAHVNDPKLIKYMLNHPLYGRTYTSELGNDPVQLQKYHMTFDDGAELTGKKLVAGFPELDTHPLPPQKPPKPPVEMVDGARSTVESPVRPTVETVYKEEPLIVGRPTKNVDLSKEEVEALIDSKLDSFLDKIGSLIIQPKEKPKATKPKEFSCPECGLKLASGFEVGRHKKEAHTTK